MKANDISMSPRAVLLLGLALLLVMVNARAAGVRAYFDHNPVYVGETVTLTIEASGRSSSAGPDLSVLDKDFRVLGTSQGSEIRIINGQRSDTVRWQVTLEPRGAGSYPVPAIAVGGQQTDALTLEVKPVPPELARRKAEMLFVEAEVGEVAGGVHVQQQVPMTVRLYSSVSISDGALSDPEPADTVVERLGDDRRYSAERNGRRYQVIERHYALFPEHSGELTIPPVSFRGSVRAPQQPRSQARRHAAGSSAFNGFNDPFFDQVFRDSGFSRMFGSDPMGMFAPRQAVTASSQPIVLQVKPRPAAAGKGNWLPAQKLELIDSWQQQVPEWQVGKPVERTITLRATGLAGSQIPQLSLEVPDGVRSYPAKPQHQSRTDGERVYGISQQTFTYIPTREGGIEMPEVQVPWWDTGSQQQRIATLPRWQVQVAPGTMPAEPVAEQGNSADGGSQQGFGSGSLQAALDQAEDSVSDAKAAAGGLLSAYQQWQARYPWGPWVLAAVLLALLMLAGARRGRRGQPGAAKTRPAAGATKPAVAETREAFNRACGAGDAVSVAQALMDWARAQWSEHPPAGLAALAARLQQGGDEVLALERALYAPEGGDWNAKALQRALSRGLVEAAQESAQRSADLAPLYPQR